jgi:Na+/melibiose symporter-like transporter
MPQAEFPRVLAAEGISNFGSMLSRLAIPWLAALLLQATPAQMAGLLLADVAASALASLWLGAWVDRSGKKRVMLLADGARCALLAGVAVAAAQGGLGMGGLVAAAALGGVLTAAFELARSAWMAQRVAAADLPRRNAQLAATGSLSEAAAFALGGWLYQALGAVLALALDAASYAASAACLRGVRELPVAAAAEPTQRPTGRALRDEALQGLHAVAAHPALRALAGIEALAATGMALAGTAYVIFVARDLGLPTGVQGMVFALGGLGSVLGASLAPRLGRQLGPGRAMTLGLTLTALGAACVPLAAAPGALAVALLVVQQVVGDGGHTVHLVHGQTLRQTAVPAALLARADAGIRTAGYLGTLVGAALGGAVGTAFNARSVLWMAAAAVAAAALLAALCLAEPRQRSPA